MASSCDINQLWSLLVFSCVVFSCVSSSHQSFSGTYDNSEKVNLSLYYESLCPYSKDFIVKPLANAFVSDLMTITNLELVPWGNAHLLNNHTVICQHGEEECYLNTIHACAINIWPDVNKHFPFIECIEMQASTSILRNEAEAEASWKECAELLELPPQPISDCYDTGMGKKFLLEFGNKTANLDPPLYGVPWVVVNDKALEPDYEDFVKKVCDQYKAKPKPKACG